MYEQLKDLLITRAGLPGEPLVPEASLAGAGIDSMAVTVLSMALEDVMGLVIDEDELSAAPSVAALAELVAERAAAASVPSP
ncbi:acyl carrier protein [Streptomyces sp. NPDC056149]|uniref:acyl carrier protein n=1 Tax=unclassified Streptomyces TaxID=2593676 RepID=UPI002380F3F1|nr:acyl carrier protein [Streptomyces sp. WZ-12]